MIIEMKNQPPMKIITALLLLSLSIYLQACRNPNEIDEGKPAIKSIFFEGVPPQNVDFDRARSTITIELPTNLRGGLKPALELTDGARIVSGVTADGFVDLTPLCYCQGYQGRSATIMIGDTSAIATQRTRKGYLIKIANQGPLKALDSDIPLTFSRKAKELYMRLPVENLYTNPHITQVDFTNVATALKEVAGFDAVCLNTCDNRYVNQLIFRLTSPIEHTLKPGTYTVSIGDIVFPQKLVVTE